MVTIAMAMKTWSPLPFGADHSWFLDLGGEVVLAGLKDVDATMPACGLLHACPLGGLIAYDHVN